MNMLDKLLAPITTADFLGSYLGKKPLHIAHGALERLSWILPNEDIERLLAFFGRPHPGGVRLAKQESELPLIHASADQPLAVDELGAQLSSGYTLNVNDVADRHEGVRAMVRALVYTFAAKVTANLFISPKEARAFPLHFDTHEVLVLQLFGQKRWRVFSPIVETPLAVLTEQRRVDPKDVGSPMLDVLLNVGDVLYIPRGFVHEVKTEASASKHLSVGLHLPTRFDLMLELLSAEAKRNPALRSALPHRALLNETPPNERDLQNALNSALMAPKPALATEAMLTQLLDSQHPLEMPRFFEPEPQELSLNTTLQHRPGLFAHVISNGVSATLLFQRGHLSAPTRAQEALLYAARNESFLVSELPGLSDRSKLVLARRLVSCGAFRPASAVSRDNSLES